MKDLVYSHELPFAPGDIVRHREGTRCFMVLVEKPLLLFDFDQKSSFDPPVPSNFVHSESVVYINPWDTGDRLSVREAVDIAKIALEEDQLSQAPLLRLAGTLRNQLEVQR